MNQVNEVIILAGGLGTRLVDRIGGLPKALAPVHDLPFLNYLLDYYQAQGIQKVILAVGHKWELIEKRYGKKYKDLTIQYSIENSPLGTGGAIRLACHAVKNENVFVCNGDTYFNINLSQLSKTHRENSADCTIALKQIENSDRYGSVEIDNLNRIQAFKEKQYQSSALINGGIYCITAKKYIEQTTTGTFSFEVDYLQKNMGLKLYGLKSESYFKDIGIPSDYEQFLQDIKNKKIDAVN